MKSIRVPLLVLIFLGVLAVMLDTAAEQSPCADQKDCGICDTTAPPALVGLGGDKKEYNFRHTADVNVGSGANLKYRYEHAIRNLRADAVLWAEWTDGGIYFQQIAPDRCGNGLSESGIKWKEDPNSTIRYGMSKQFAQRASAYVPEAKSKRFPATAKTVPTLTSRLHGKVLWQDELVTLDLLFETQVLPNLSFAYSVTNKGSREVFFKLPALTSRWVGYGILDAAIKKSEWQRLEKPPDLFRLGIGKSAKLEIAKPDIEAFLEERSEIKVGLAAEDRFVAQGILSIYLPPPPSVSK